MRYWPVATTAEFDNWFSALPSVDQVEVIATVELLKVLGPSLRRPHADTLNGSKYPNMKELRADSPAHALRVAFAFDPRRSAILLIGGCKSGVGQKQFYRQLVEKADRLYAAHLATLPPKE